MDDLVTKVRIGREGLGQISPEGMTGDIDLFVGLKKVEAVGIGQVRVVLLEGQILGVKHPRWSKRNTQVGQQIQKIIGPSDRESFLIREEKKKQRRREATIR